MELEIGTTAQPGEQNPAPPAPAEPAAPAEGEGSSLDGMLGRVNVHKPEDGNAQKRGPGRPRTVNPHGAQYPADYDHERKLDESAPMGYLKSGEPWAPFGRTRGGRIRRRPTREQQKAAHGAPAEPRRAPGPRVPVEEHSNLSVRLDAWLRDGERLVAEWRRRHPESEIGDVIDPRSRAKDAKIDVPLTSVEAVQEIIDLGVELTYEPLGIEKRPGDKVKREAAEHVAELTQYAGATVSPKSASWIGAAVPLLIILAPVLAELAVRAIGFFVGGEPAEEPEGDQL